MSDATTTTLLVALLVVLTSGGAVALGTGGLGASGPADAGQAPAAQETTQNATTAGGEGAQAQDETQVSLRNVTLEQLTLRNVTVLDGQFRRLTVVNGTEGNETRRTYRNVSVRRMNATGFVTDVTLANVTIRNETLAEALVGETGRVRIETRLVMDEAVLSNRTVNGLAVENATVYAGAAENLSVDTTGGDAAGDADAGTDGTPAIAADSAVVENFSLTNLDVSGVSPGETAGTATATATATATVTPTETATATRTATGETTQQDVVVETTQTTATAETPTAETTTAEPAGETTRPTETTPAEARSGATDDDTTTADE